MFLLKLLDRNGNPLKEGDLVKISNGKRFKFYSEVKFLEDEMAIAPFHTFSFHSFEKVEELPHGAVLREERGQKWWYVPEGDDLDLGAAQHEDYLGGWRLCERKIDGRSWVIERLATQASMDSTVNA